MTASLARSGPGLLPRSGDGEPAHRAPRGRRGLLHPGPRVHLAHHATARRARPLGLQRGHAVADPADDGRARRCRLGARRTCCPLHRQRPRAAHRAAARCRRGAGAGARSGVPRVRGGDGGVRRRAGRRGREHQHAGRRDRARLRPADPAVLPRHVDARRHRRLGHHPRDEHGRLPVGGPGGRAAVGGRVRAVPAPRSRCRRRRCPGRRGSRPVATAAAGRRRAGALLHGRHGRGHVGTDLPRRRLRHPVRLVALATLPYLVASGAMRLAGDTWSRASGRWRFSGTAPWSPSVRSASSCSRRRGRSLCSASPCWDSGSR